MTTVQYKPNQRVAFYEVTGISDPSPAKNLEIGSILIDRPRGEYTDWQFLMNNTTRGWITGKRLGFARVNPATMQAEPEPKLAAILEARKDELK